VDGAGDGAGRQWFQESFRQGLDLRRGHVSHHDGQGVVRSVIAPEIIQDIAPPPVPDIVFIADDRPTVGVDLIGHGTQLRIEEFIIAVLVTGGVFRQDYAPFVFQHLFVQGQGPEAVPFHGEDQGEHGFGHPILVGRDIFRRIGVSGPPGVFQNAVEHLRTV